MVPILITRNSRGRSYLAVASSLAYGSGAINKGSTADIAAAMPYVWLCLSRMIYLVAVSTYRLAHVHAAMWCVHAVAAGQELVPVAALLLLITHGAQLLPHRRTCMQG